MKQKTNGVEVLPPVNDKKARAEAMQLHTEAVHEVNAVKQSIVRLGGILVKLKDPKHRRWEFISIKNHKNGFKSWNEYAEFLVGPISHGKIYELIAAHELTTGPNPIAPKVVKEIGIKKAAELARLKPKDRTPAVIKAVRDASYSKAKHVVQELINMDLPEKDRREPTVLFTRNLSGAAADAMEELEQDGQYMEGIRDGDSSVTLRSKFWQYVCLNFRETHKTELAEAKKYRLAMEAKDAKTTVAARKRGEEEEELVPPTPRITQPSSTKVIH